VELVDGCLEGVVGDEGLVTQLAVGLGTGAVPVLIGCMYPCMNAYIHAFICMRSLRCSTVCHFVMTMTK